MLNDTITAISTPPGEGGIGVIRISGKNSFRILDAIFTAKNTKKWEETPGFTMHLGHIRDAEGKIFDEVLVSIMKEPKSFTGENVVEVNCHGGSTVLRNTLELIIKAGARLAEPGEFSKRAFLNGRIDLSQAEAIIDLIRAKTDKGLTAAINQLQGNLSKKINAMRHNLLGLIAKIEASIDFPEEDLEEVTGKEISATIDPMMIEIEDLLKTFEHGKFIREGINTVILGRTNVGKSSILNALLKEERAIVTDIPGTTRDTIEEYLNIGGFPLVITDTAGIRETDDLVEKLGVQKSKEMVQKADLVLLVLDIFHDLLEQDQELLELVRDKKVIVIINKIDLDINDTEKNRLQKTLDHLPHIFISAKEELGLKGLEEKIIKIIMEDEIGRQDDLMITNIRHKEKLIHALHFLNQVKEAQQQEMSLDFLSIDIKEAWEALGEITGDAAYEDLLDRIFTEFCIGK